LKSASGTVELCGKDLNKLSRRSIAKQLGYLPQLCGSVFNYRVEEVVAMGRFCHLKGMGFIDETDAEQIERAMAATETFEYKGRFLDHLSGGERQRVLLASVLCQEPKVLLLDEPTTGLDIHHKVAFFSLLKKLANDGMAVCVVTHDLNLAAMSCNNVMLLKGGSVVKTGDVNEVINEEVLGGIYPDNIFVGTHPVSGVPMVLPTDTKGGL
jgi:iron complex transport system ATP-binding protein